MLMSLWIYCLKFNKRCQDYARETFLPLQGVIYVSRTNISDYHHSRGQFIPNPIYFCVQDQKLQKHCITFPSGSSQHTIKNQSSVSVFSQPQMTWKWNEREIKLSEREGGVSDMRSWMRFENVENSFQSSDDYRF